MFSFDEALKKWEPDVWENLGGLFSIQGAWVLVGFFDSPTFKEIGNARVKKMGNDIRKAVRQQILGLALLVLVAAFGSLIS